MKTIQIGSVKLLEPENDADQAALELMRRTGELDPGYMTHSRPMAEHGTKILPDGTLNPNYAEYHPDSVPKPLTDAQKALIAKWPPELQGVLSGEKMGPAPNKNLLVSPRYTKEQRAAIKSYTMTGFVAINEYLRGISTTPEARANDPYHAMWEDRVERQIAALNSAIKPLPQRMMLLRGITSAGLVNRGEPIRPAEAKPKIDALVGKTISDPAFLSTTMKSNYGGYDVHIYIDTPKGTPAIVVDGASEFPSEQEVLLAPGTKLRIDSVAWTPIHGLNYAQEATIGATVVP